jgi:methylated-DNA-protein-cysteine methyltransferase related protein
MDPSMASDGSAYARIFRAVRAIPRGRVAAYGQVAAQAGLPGRARQVGFALRELGDGGGRGAVPWHRVIAADGRISLVGEAAAEQRARLLAEGIVFDARGRVDLRRFGLVERGAPRSVGRRTRSATSTS